MDEIFILESWVVQLLNRIAEASERDEDFTLHMDKDEVKKVQEAYAETIHIEIY